MATATEKYLSEFTLTPEGTHKLQDFMDANRLALSDVDEPAKQRFAQDKLRELLEQVMPKEVLAVLKDVFAGTSDRVIAIHGFPEGRLTNALDPVSNDFYSYYLSKALYSAVGAHHIESAFLKRDRIGSRAHLGMTIHRDNLPVVRNRQFCEYIIFSSPHNAENAVTEFIHLRDAIESIPQESRAKIQVDVIERRMNSYRGTLNYIHESRNLNEVLESLANRDVDDLNNTFIKGIALLNTPDSAEGQAFLEAIKQHGVMYNIQPGSLLVLSEGSMFHRAHSGSVESLPNEPGYTRYFLHNAGAARR